MAGLRIFLCHASEDKERVRELSDRLTRDGFDVWLDEERLLPRQDWDFAITQAVRNSDVVVVCISDRSAAKVGYVQRELRTVLDVALTRFRRVLKSYPAVSSFCAGATEESQSCAAAGFSSATYASLPYYVDS